MNKAFKTAVALSTVLTLGACSSTGQLCGLDPNCIESWATGTSAEVGQLTAAMETLYTAINSLSEATLPSLCSTLENLDSYYQLVATAGVTSAAENSDEASAMAALKATCSGGGNLSIATLTTEALQVYSVIEAALANHGVHLHHSSLALRHSLAMRHHGH